jgi:hypothetical protein
VVLAAFAAECGTSRLAVAAERRAATTECCGGCGLSTLRYWLWLKLEMTSAARGARVSYACSCEIEGS